MEERIYTIFASPNTRTSITLREAIKALTGNEQSEMRNAARVFLPDAEIYDAIGIWTDGAENSIEVCASLSPREAIETAALLGYSANQKGIYLIDRESQDEPDAKKVILARVWDNPSIAEIAQRIAEITPYATITPTRPFFRVTIAETELHAETVKTALSKWYVEAVETRAKSWTIGGRTEKGEIYGAPYRTAARAVYQKILTRQ